MSSNPEKTLKRILSISHLDGRSVTFIAGVSTVLSLCFFDWFGGIIGGLVTFAGLYELRGRKRLLAGDAEGMTNLVRAQLLILATVWVYSVICLVTFNEAKSASDMAAALGGYGMDARELGPYVKKLNQITYLTVIVVTLLFQGGLARYYHSRRAIVAQALADRAAAAAALAARPTPPPVPPLA